MCRAPRCWSRARVSSCTRTLCFVKLRGTWFPRRTDHGSSSPSWTGSTRWRSNCQRSAGSFTRPPRSTAISRGRGCRGVGPSSTESPSAPLTTACRQPPPRPHVARPARRQSSCHGPRRSAPHCQTDWRASRPDIGMVTRGGWRVGPSFGHGQAVVGARHQVSSAAPRIADRPPVRGSGWRLRAWRLSRRPR